VVVIATVLVTVTFQAVRAEDAAVLLTRAQALFQPLPQEMDTAALPTSPARVALGRMLFFDPRWTVEGNVSCATCHQPALYGTDALTRSIGAQHRTHPRHAPTVLNAALNFVQHWWGDRQTLEEQAEQALVGVFSSGQPDQAAVTARIEAIEGYALLGGIVDVELVVSYAYSTCIAMAMQSDEHDGGSPHRQHDPIAVEVSGTTTV
jgi:cytochrome c peroxidase